MIEVYIKDGEKTTAYVPKSQYDELLKQFQDERSKESDSFSKLASKNETLLSLVNAYEKELLNLPDGKDIITYVRNTLGISDKTEKQAEWVGVNPQTDSVMCSNCNYFLHNIELTTRYCPDCGYKMSVNKELKKLYGLEDV